MRRKTGADKVYVVAHSMGGLVARCMIQKICRSTTTRRQRPPAPPARTSSRSSSRTAPRTAASPSRSSALDWAEKAFGPAGSRHLLAAEDVRLPHAGRDFGDEPADGAKWDPQTIEPDVFDADDIFCLIGTDPQDYGLSEVVVGPKSDGLVRIEHAYVRGANRAYVYKSHSGSYGEVNSEEGYQNLRRFLFGRWRVQVDFDGLPPAPARTGSGRCGRPTCGWPSGDCPSS